MKHASHVENNTLGRFVVRVEFNGQTVGTGFFVSPGLLLTSAHVVRDSTTVTVVTHESLAPEPLMATVLARSQPPSGDSLWPYPDLAILRLEQLIEHPCVWLEYTTPRFATDCSAWGFTQREEGQIPDGSPASFQYEGAEGDGFLRLKAGQAEPGLSGSPLLSMEQRAVIGIMSASRNINIALGGWATSTEALSIENRYFRADPEILKLLQEISIGNRKEVLSNRGTWHKIFDAERIPGYIKQSWETFQDHPNSSPLDLILCEYGVVPYLFRDSEINEMIKWCQAEPPMSISWVSAEGGAGKTRYAIEICKRMAESGWITGFLSPLNSLEVRDILADSSMSPKFLVIDYIEAEASEKLRDVLDALRRRATDISPIRVLLLTRTRADSEGNAISPIARVSKPPLLNVLNNASERFKATQVLTIEQRDALYLQAIQSFSIRGSSKVVQTSPPEPLPDLSANHFSEPLNILFEALDYSMNTNALSINRGSAVDRVIEHEQRYWNHSAPADSNPFLNRFCVALATLFGANSRSEIDQIFQASIPELQSPTASRLRFQLAIWLESLYTGSQYLNPLRPDRLGEALISSLFLELQKNYEGSEESAKSILIRIFKVATLEQINHALELFSRMDNYNEKFDDLIIDVISNLPNEFFPTPMQTYSTEFPYGTDGDEESVPEEITDEGSEDNEFQF